MTAVPRFKRGVKFRFDTVRNVWIILAPEKLRLGDGAGTTDQIGDGLARRFDAPRETIADDVVAALDDLSLRGAIQL